MKVPHKQVAQLLLHTSTRFKSILDDPEEMPVRPGAEDAASFPAAPLRGWPTDPGGDNPGSSGPPAKHS